MCAAVTLVMDDLTKWVQRRRLNPLRSPYEDDELPHTLLCNKMVGMGGASRRPLGFQPSALHTELHSHKLAEPARIELAR